MINCPKCNGGIPNGSTNCPTCNELIGQVDVQNQTNGINSGEMSAASLGATLPDATIQLEMPSFLKPVEPTIAPAEIQPPVQPVIEQQNPVVNIIPEVEVVAAQDMFAAPTEGKGSRAGVLPEGMLQANLAQPLNQEPVVVEEEIPEPQLAPSIPILEEPSIENNEITIKEKIGAKITTTIVIAISIVAIGIVIMFAIVLMDSNEANRNLRTNTETTLKIYDGFRLYIPAEMKSEIINGELFLSDEELTWSASLTLQTGNFNTMISNRLQLGEAYEEFGYIAEEPIETTIVGKGFLIFEVSMGSERVLVAYTRASGTKIWGIVFRNEKAEYSAESLRAISILLNTTEDRVPQGLPEGFSNERFIETFKVSR